MTDGSGVALSVLGSGFHVASDDVRMSELVALLWDPFVVPGPRGDAGAFELRRVAGGWRVKAPGYPGGESPDPWTVLSVLRNLLSGRAIRAAGESIVPLHGAAVERDGTFLVLCGPARAGKTTLLLELLDRGWRYVTDDLVPIDRDRLTAAAFPKPLSVREPGLWRRYARLWPVPGWLPPPAEVGLIPPTAFPPHEGDAYQPDVLVFPHYSPGADPELEPLSPAAAVALAADNLHVPAADPSTLGILAGLGGKTASYAVRYGSTEHALEVLGKCLAHRSAME